MFGDSNLDKLLGINLSDWRVYDSIPFWTTIVFTLLGVGTLYINKRPKFSNYCIVEKGITKENLSMFEVFKILFIVRMNVCRGYLS